MRINCHTHVFNLQTVFTPRTKQLLADRLQRQGIDEPIRSLLLNLATAMIEAKGKYAPASGLESLATLERVGDKLMEQDVVDPTDATAGSSRSGGVELAALKNSLQTLVEMERVYHRKQKLDQALAKLVPAHVDAQLSTFMDWWEFLRTALSNMDQITDKLLAGMGEDDVIVALMVEYYAPNDRKVDRQYAAQIEGTLRQALRRPGRVLPFFGVDTRRPDHLAMMHKYLEEGSCLGIKIYPSAGFPVDDSLMEQVFAACESLDVPVLVHCGTGGFCDSQCIDFASPRHWDAILQRHPKLRVCFGHFGGDEFFVGEHDLKHYPKSWMSMILELMQKYPGRVYADISYHAAYGKPAKQEKYKSVFNSIINQYPYQVLWGTDYIMLLMNMEDSTYIKLFEQLINSASTFDRIARTNAMAYLGIHPTDASKHGANIRRHLEWLKRQKDEGNILPPRSVAKWLPHALYEYLTS